MPNEEFGEEVKAIVVANSLDDEAAMTSLLLEHCRINLAGYKVPRTIEFRDELPRTGTGKIQKRRLRDRYWEGIDRSV